MLRRVGMILGSIKLSAIGIISKCESAILNINNYTSNYKIRGLVFKKLHLFLLLYRVD